MLRVLIICEGYTEKLFINSCLYPHFLKKNIIITTKNMQGNVSVERLADFMRKSAGNFDYVTSFVDFYGFKHNRNPDGTPKQTITELQDSVINKVTEKSKKSNQSFSHLFPYIQQYEFEALLFCNNVEAFSLLDSWNEDSGEKLQRLMEKFPNPEDINHGMRTAPSKRLIAIFGDAYDKVEFGSLIAEDIGLEKMRKKCPKFNHWLSRIESLI